MALFWKPSIILDLYWQVWFNFELQSLFWLTDKKIDILDDFTPGIENVELELGSNYECTKSMIGLV